MLQFHMLLSRLIFVVLSFHGIAVREPQVQGIYTGILKNYQS